MRAPEAADEIVDVDAVRTRLSEDQAKLNQLKVHL